VCVCVKSRWYY